MKFASEWHNLLHDSSRHIEYSSPHIFIIRSIKQPYIRSDIRRKCRKYHGHWRKEKRNVTISKFFRLNEIFITKFWRIVTRENKMITMFKMSLVLTTFIVFLHFSFLTGYHYVTILLIKKSIWTIVDVAKHLAT